MHRDGVDVAKPRILPLLGNAGFWQAWRWYCDEEGLKQVSEIWE